jgi:hypothetical protein
MKASFRRIWNSQLVTGHAVAVTKQYPALAGDEYGAREVSGLNEGLEIRLKTTRYLTVRQVLTAPDTAKQEHTCDLQSAIERFHLVPPGSLEDERTG